jgi:hypothetical protein
MHGSAMPWITNRISTPSGEPKRATSEILPDAQLLDRLATSVLTLTIASVIPGHAQHDPGISQPSPPDSGCAKWRASDAQLRIGRYDASEAQHQPWTDPAILLCMGLISLFCAAQVLWKDAIDGLHQYWDECLNLEQLMTVTEVCRYGGLFVVADRDRPNVAKVPPRLTPPLPSRKWITPWHTRCT